jgi:hypothetical protein
MELYKLFIYELVLPAHLILIAFHRPTFNQHLTIMDCKSVIDDLFFNAFTVIILIYDVLCDPFDYNFWQLFLSVIFLKYLISVTIWYEFWFDSLLYEFFSSIVLL